MKRTFIVIFLVSAMLLTACGAGSKSGGSAGSDQQKLIKLMSDAKNDESTASETYSEDYSEDYSEKYQENSSEDYSADYSEAASDESDFGFTQAQEAELVDGRLTSFDGYYSFVPPEGWEYSCNDNDSGDEIYAYCDDKQFDIVLDYLNGYTLEEMAGRLGMGSDGNAGASPEKKEYNGNSYYCVGPLVDPFGHMTYFCIAEWDDERFVNVKMMLLSDDATVDEAKKYLDSDEFRDLIDSVEINVQ